MAKSTRDEVLTEYYLRAAGVAAVWIDADSNVGAQDVASIEVDPEHTVYCCARGVHFTLASHSNRREDGRMPDTKKAIIAKRKSRPAAAERKWDGDVAGDVRNLSHLIDALVSSLHEVEFVKADGSRNEELDRVSALAWIARDLAEELKINTSR